jgi:hypothetical protein
VRDYRARKETNRINPVGWRKKFENEGILKTI